MLADHPDHLCQCCSHGVGPGHAAFRVQHIGQSSSDPMGFALDLGHAVAHGKKQGAVGEVARQEPEAVIPQIQYDASFRQLRREMRARDDGDRAAMASASGRRRWAPGNRGASFPSRQQMVPGGKKDQFIASTGFIDHGVACGAIGLGGRQTGLGRRWTKALILSVASSARRRRSFDGAGAAAVQHPSVDGRCANCSP